MAKNLSKRNSSELGRRRMRKLAARETIVVAPVVVEPVEVQVPAVIVPVEVGHVKVVVGVALLCNVPSHATTR